MAKDDGFIEVQENSSPEEEAAAAQEAVESLPKATGKGMFSKARKASRAPQPVESEDSDEGESSLEAEASEPAPAPKPKRAAKKAKPSPEEAAAEEPTAEELISDNLAKRIEEALLAEQPMEPARSAALKRQESRSVQAAQEEAQRAKQTLDAVLAALKPGQAQADQEPEEEVDIFSDPDKFLDRKNKPVLTKMQQLEQMVSGLQQQLQAQSIRAAEAQFAAQNPTYNDRVKKFNEAAYSEALEFFGGDEQAAGEMMNQTWAGWLMFAQRAGRHPFEIVNEMTARYLRGRGLPVPGENGQQQPQTQQPPAKTPPAKAVRRDGSIAAAQAAVASAAGRSLSGGGAEAEGSGGPLTAAALTEMGPKQAAQAVRQLIAQRGVKSADFSTLMQDLESRAASERGR